MIRKRKESHWEKMENLNPSFLYDYGWNKALREMLYVFQDIFSPPEFPEDFELPCE